MTLKLTRTTLLILSLSILVFASAAMADDTPTVEAPQAATTATTANPTDGDLGADANEIQTTSDAPMNLFLSPVSQAAPSASWNCGGCVEPSSCSSNAHCGYPQGVCLWGSCRCICDPGV